MAIPVTEINEILAFLKGAGVVATAMYFHRHRDTIRRLYKKHGIDPAKGRLKELDMKSLENKWKSQDTCSHPYWIKKCSSCGKILGSDSKE